MKSEEGILQGEGREMVEVDLTKLSAILLPRIPGVAGSPEEFNSKISLIEREKNTFYAENRKTKAGIERITN